MLRPLAIFGILILLATPSLAAELSQVPLPEIGKGMGEACVADTEFMRRNHMNLLGHQRDETLREGIRGARYSLRECVACHAVPDAQGVAVKAADPRHFCSACHDYAAVRIDCFECHASRPEMPSGVGSQASAPNTAGANGPLAMVGRDWQ